MKQMKTKAALLTHPPRGGSSDADRKDHVSDQAWIVVRLRQRHGSDLWLLSSVRKKHLLPVTRVADTGLNAYRD